MNTLNLNNKESKRYLINYLEQVIEKIKACDCSRLISIEHSLGTQKVPSSTGFYTIVPDGIYYYTINIGDACECFK